MIQDHRTLILGHDNDSIEVHTRKSVRAKRISIKISLHKGVELVIPKRVSARRALEFLYSKEHWILNKSKQMRLNRPVPLVDGSFVSVQGERYNIKHSGMLRGVTHIEGSDLIVSGPKESSNRKVQQFLQELARKEIVARVEIEAMKLGVKYNKITIRDTTSRWGSCSKQKNLSFSWRLIMAPRDVLEYVVAHEVAHLVEMNHSKKFWKIVSSIFPEHLSSRVWLKENGSSLHSFGQS